MIKGSQKQFDPNLWKYNFLMKELKEKKAEEDEKYKYEAPATQNEIIILDRPEKTGDEKYHALQIRAMFQKWKYRKV